MPFPQKHKLPCAPLGELEIIFDVMNDDDDFFVPEELGESATSKILNSWSSVWSSAQPMLDQLLADYKQDATSEDLLTNPDNTLNVMVLLPEEDEDAEFRFELFINKRTQRGSIVFGVEFVELEPESASATF